MPIGYSQTPTLLRGALIQFSAPMLVPVPNVIIFQYNPETMTRTLTPWAPSEAQAVHNKDGTVGGPSLSAEQINQLSQPYDPQETFSLVLELDATDDLETPELHPIAVASGVADRIAAIEMLCYPPKPASSLASATASVAVSAGSAQGDSTTAKTLNNLEVPIVLFFWGPGRIVPVRIKSLSIEEQQYSPTLFPLRAKVTVQLAVLDENQLVNVAGLQGQNSATVEIAKACYNFTKAQKKALALANISNAADSIIGMLPT